MVGGTSSLYTFSLPWIANYSNYFSVIIVFASFLIMVVFILRMNGDMGIGSSGVVYLDNTPQQSMVGLQNPFVVKFLNDMDTLQDGVKLLVSALQPMTFTELWGTDINALHAGFDRPSDILLEELNTDHFINGECLHYHSKSLPVCSQKTLELTCPDNVTEETIGAAPRRKYPLVIICSPENSQYAQEQEVVVAAVYILHLKDGICSQKSHVIYHYIKTNRNSIFHMQSLYVNSPSEEETEHFGENTNNSSDQLPVNLYRNGVSSENCEDSTNKLPDSTECVVCQCNTVHCALLPCRHACVCCSCLKKLDSCPMCRTFIISYFKLTSVEMDTETESEDDGCCADNDNRWRKVWTRFKEMFGFS